MKLIFGILAIGSIYIFDLYPQVNDDFEMVALPEDNLFKFYIILILVLNFCLCYGELQAIDNGGSLYIHTFGAIFGIVVSIVNFCPSQEFSKISSSPHLSSDYYSNIFSFIGSLFL